MTARVEMFCGVFPDGVVAAANMSAAHTKAKMDPLHPQLETFFAAFRRAGLDVLNEIQMTAFFHGTLI